REPHQFWAMWWRRMQLSRSGTAPIVLEKDTEGRYLFANRQFAEMTGHPLADVIGRRDTEVLPPKLAEECRRNDSLVLAERRPLDFEEHGEADGELRIYLTLKFPLL